ncbi:coiled-coil domain-containing protein 62 isoform X2 [Hemicordylus capensis]|uniref:coiled-coil domain-containing protein 62 isoform X2 n=1 Tax=Hemicordylus capensis TaxID=884348 RepID=UPI002303AD18|nr:coiled-coil domain-containing protein 62 isoform X2 [Hemicordylus capensis]
MNPSLTFSTPPQNPNPDLESLTIQKQRKELQLLIVELKDRDKELNDMVVIHQRQLLAWEDDRQKILTLAERCSRLENELHKRNEMITALTQRLKLLESQQKDRKITLENTQQKLQELSQRASDTSHQCQALEEKNQSLSSSVMELSNKVGQLQAREQELLTMLKLKDNDILEATNHITEFTCKFKKLENALRAARMEESSTNREKQDFKLRLKEIVLETNKLKGDLSEKTRENNEQREEIIRLKQENNYLNNELMLSAERANRKDQLLHSAKSKQLRTDTELSNLRQIYVKQQRDLQFLHFNLESSQETKQKHKKEARETSRSSEKICQVCRAESRQPMGTEARRSGNLDQFQEGLFHEQITPRKQERKQNDSSSAGETDSRPASLADSMWTMEGRELMLVSEPNLVASLPIHEHWFDLNSGAEPPKCQSHMPKRSDKSMGDSQAGTPGGPRLSKSPGLVKMLDSGCCSCCSISKTILSQPVTDQEWMQIFKPVKGGGGGGGGGGVPCGAFPSSPKSTRGIKVSKSKSDHDGDLNLSELGAPCLTSTQKTSRPKIHEKFVDGDLPLELASLTDLEAATGCCHSPLHHDSCSPTSKLQRLLAESRQMVADLELSNLLCTSPRCSPNSSSSIQTAMEYPKPLCKGRLPAVEESEMKLSLFSL